MIRLAGKLTPKELSDIFEKIYKSEKEQPLDVLVGPKIGEDAAVVKVPQGRYMVVTSDPIVGATEGVGKYLVNVNVNDIAAKGGDPKYLILTIIAPVWGGKRLCEDIIAEVKNECQKFGISLIGGHTEVSDKYQHPVISGTMIGFADDVKKVEMIEDGDVLAMTKHAGIEGMTILAGEGYLDNIFRSQEIKEILSWQKDLSVLPESKILRKYAKYMHDPTEGGIKGAIVEITYSLDFGIKLYLENVPVHPLTKKAAEMLKFDPLSLISSGVLMAAMSEGYFDKAKKELEKLNIEFTMIGRFSSRADKPIFPFKEELWRLIG